MDEPLLKLPAIIGDLFAEPVLETVVSLVQKRVDCELQTRQHLALKFDEERLHLMEVALHIQIP